MLTTLEHPGLDVDLGREKFFLSAEAVSQPRRIRQWAQKAYKARNVYGEKTAAKVTGVLAKAEKDVKAALLKYTTLGDLPNGKLANQRSLRKLQGEIRALIAQTRDEHRLILKHASTANFKRGLSHGIEEFAAAQLPFYKHLGSDGINKMSTNVFTVIDTSALDFMTRFNMQLAGDVSRELTDGLNRTIQVGIATGMSVRDIAKEMGTVVTDKEAFRHAGKKVFGKAQTRMELIARTETMRAHSQGQRKFYSTVGVRKLEWMTMDDERMCPECEALDGKVYPIDKFPGQPKHPRCRCGHTAVIDLPICGAGGLGAQAAASPGCILSPQDVEAEAVKVKADQASVKYGIKSGNFDNLTAKQLKMAAKQQGVSIARTKADFIKLLDQAEPGISHSTLSGQALKAKLAKHKIGALRTKQELIDLLTKSAKSEVYSAEKKGFGQFTVKELQQKAFSEGISIHMTKQDVIEHLDLIEPGVDHSLLSGQSLAAAKQKHGIGALKNKQQLVKALNKQAGQQAAEHTKKQTKDKELAVKVAHAKEVAVKKQVFQKQIAGMSGTDIKKLAQKTKIKHYQWASKGDLVTLLAETDPAKVQAAKDAIEAKHAKWAEKHGPKKPKTKKPAPAPKPESVPVSAPAFAKKGSEFEVADEAWKQKGEPKNFKLQGKAKIEGAHTKFFYTDEKGEKWLFKPADQEFLAHGDEAAYRIGRLIDPKAVEVRVITLNGKTGSIQKWKSGLAAKKDFSGVDPTNLSPGDVEQIQREHVVDWLISNHDGHGKQFVRMRNGKVHGIDKGQLFKFIGDDKLSIDYHPNRTYGETEPYYNTVFRAAKQGKVKFDPQATLRYVCEVEKISDDEYRTILAPYAERRFGRSTAKKDAFYRTALDRKRNMRRDFEKFYGNVLGDKSFRFEQTEVPLKKGSCLGKAEIKALADAKRAGWQGKVIPFDVEDVEDQNALVFTETVNGKPRTAVRMKIRPEAESKMLKNLAVTSNDKLVVDVGDTLPQDAFHDKVLAGIKTVNSHVDKGDFKYNQDSLANVKKVMPQLRKLEKSKDPDEAAMAAAYLKECQKVLDGAESNKKYTGKFTQYRKQFKSEPDLKKPVEEITARKTKVRMVKRRIRNGKITVEQELASTADVFERTMKDGIQYEIDMGDGMTATYKPWVNGNYYAHQGEFEVHLPGDADPKQFDRMMERLDRMGVNATISTPQDTELMYLQKQAYVLKADKSASYKKVMQDLDRRSASKEERIARLRGFWEKKLGVPNLTKASGYDPTGEHQLQWNDPKRRAGYRHQMRFDISDEGLERDMAGYGLHHRLTDDSSMPKFVDEVLGSNGAMASTVEKMRVGIKPGGMSPQEDMNTGGASYFFTRIRKLPGQRGGSRTPGLYFKKRMLRRMDAITYSGDKYGRVTADTVRKNRRSNIEDWKKIASRGGNDETIFKYSVTLFDNIEVVAVSNQSERTKVIQAFRKHGIKRLPDGRKIEEVVVTR